MVDGAHVEVQHQEPGALQRHFTPKELAQRWALDESTIRRMFMDEPGVLKIGKANRRDGKRDYITLRIPESVALRVHQRRSRGA
jgi:hypothetical protein